eukprot:354746-Chlamydomonas_euryale.AAC.6
MGVLAGARARACALAWHWAGRRGRTLACQQCFADATAHEHGRDKPPGPRCARHHEFSSFLVTMHAHAPVRFVHAVSMPPLAPLSLAQRCQHAASGPA